VRRVVAGGDVASRIDGVADDVVIKVPPAVARAEAPTPGLRISTAVWAIWWKSAHRRAREARKKEDAGEKFEGIMEDSMAAIVASASALGGFAASIRKEVPDADLAFSKTKKTATEKKVFEIVKRAADLGGEGEAVLADLVRLFKLRDPLVHPDEELQEPVPHADRPDVRVSVETAAYSASNAELAAEIVYRIVRVCRDRAKPAASEFFEGRRILIAEGLEETSGADT
jgi:hypothetical protein